MKEITTRNFMKNIGGIQMNKFFIFIESIILVLEILASSAITVFALILLGYLAYVLSAKVLLALMCICICFIWIVYRKKIGDYKHGKNIDENRS